MKESRYKNNLFAKKFNNQIECEPMNNQSDTSIRDISWWKPVLFAAMAGGMGWGIRGQYGHETGAMIAGVLVSLTLVFLLCPKASLLNTARAVAWGTVAMGFGGSMTYGQTVGLTHNADMVNNWEALRWGLLGLSIKGGLWIGFAGLFLGIGLGGIRYRCRELLLVMCGIVGMYFLGVYLLNSPFDRSNQMLPAIYFSASWYWQPGEVIKPRPECWGGLLLALLALMAYVRLMRKDILANRLALWGFLGGAIGFPLGQCIQAFHAWNPALFIEGFGLQLQDLINWWNMMETTFGAVMGASLGLGLWLNRKRIKITAIPDAVSMPLPIEGILLIIHIGLLIAVEFMSFSIVDRVYDIGLIMGVIPVLAIAGARWWPYLVIFPITLLPICGKTVKQLVYQEAAITPVAGWWVYLIIPLLISTAIAIWFGSQTMKKQTGYNLTRFGLLLSTWTYFMLNFAFFRFPWPWDTWTSRTPNGIIFTICALGLTAAVMFGGNKEPNSIPSPE